MSHNINLRDGEISVVIGDASVNMNVNTAFEVIEKLFKRADCSKNEDDVNDTIKNADFVTHNSICPHMNTEGITKNDTCANVQKVKSRSANCNNKVRILAFAFDSERAAKSNDLRAGVGKYIAQFDSMSAVDNYYNVASGTARRVVNTWIPYVYCTGSLNPMIVGISSYLQFLGMKNPRFSSKHNGNRLRWNFTPSYNRPKGVERIVLFRADALPQFILDRYFPKKN